jgi:hypothetical protein
MGYPESLKAAGAKVLSTKYAGSYQGTWGCIVEYNGKKGLVTGSYGSCTVCDAFESEFGYSKIPYEQDGKYYEYYGDEITKQEFDELNEQYNNRLANFGKSYLHVIQYKWDVQNQLDNLSKDEDNWYDHEQLELLNWAINLL